jgi:hypothetical protein
MAMPFETDGGRLEGKRNRVSRVTHGRDDPNGGLMVGSVGGWVRKLSYIKEPRIRVRVRVRVRVVVY